MKMSLWTAFSVLIATLGIIVYFGMLSAQEVATDRFARGLGASFVLFGCFNAFWSTLSDFHRAMKEK